MGRGAAETLVCGRCVPSCARHPAEAVKLGALLIEGSLDKDIPRISHWTVNYLRATGALNGGDPLPFTFTPTIEREALEVISDTYQDEEGWYVGYAEGERVRSDSPMDDGRKEEHAEHLAREAAKAALLQPANAWRHYYAGTPDEFKELLEDAFGVPVTWFRVTFERFDPERPDEPPHGKAIYFLTNVERIEDASHSDLLFLSELFLL